MVPQSLHFTRNGLFCAAFDMSDLLGNNWSSNSGHSRSRRAVHEILCRLVIRIAFLHEVDQFQKAGFFSLGTVTFCQRDQFLALMEVETVTRDATRHFGLVVSDRDGLRARMEADGVPFVSQKRFDFLDPWGNRVEVVDYREIQFLKPRAVLDAQGFDDLRKNRDALDALRDKGIAPPEDS